MNSPLAISSSLLFLLLVIYRTFPFDFYSPGANPCLNNLLFIEVSCHGIIIGWIKIRADTRGWLSFFNFVSVDLLNASQSPVHIARAHSKYVFGVLLLVHLTLFNRLQRKVCMNQLHPAIKSHPEIFSKSNMRCVRLNMTHRSSHRLGFQVGLTSVCWCRCCWLPVGVEPVVGEHQHQQLTDWFLNMCPALCTQMCVLLRLYQEGGVVPWQLTLV